MVVSVISTSGSLVRQTTIRTAALTTRPMMTPPPSVHRKVGTTLATVGDAPAAMAATTANPTAATPSFRRLSDSTTIDTRGWQPSSRNEAITDTGSVAAMRTPNSAAPIQLQPTSQCIPPATTAAASATPRNAIERVSGSSARNLRHSSCIAASNTSGGRKTLKMSCRDKGSVGLFGSNATTKPATTSPTMYGKPSRRETIAIAQAMRSRIPIGAKAGASMGGPYQASNNKTTTRTTTKQKPQHNERTKEERLR